MAQNAPLAILGGEATPITHTFSPSGIQNDIASYQNLLENLINGRERCTLNRAVGKLRSPSVNLVVPYVVDETLNSVTNRRVLNFGTAKTIFQFPLDWTPAMCKVVRVLQSNLLLNAAVVALTDNDEHVW